MYDIPCHIHHILTSYCPRLKYQPNMTTTLVPGYVVHIRNIHKASSKAKSKIVTENIELLPTMTNSYDITGHVTMGGAQKQACWPHLEGHFSTVYISKSYTHPSRNLTRLIVTPNTV